MNYIIKSIRCRCKHIVIILFFLIYSGFILAQMGVVRFIPVKSEMDIKHLEQEGEDEYLYKELSDKEVATAFCEEINAVIKQENIYEKWNVVGQQALEKIESGSSVEAVLKEYESSTEYEWLKSRYDLAKKEYAKPEEINKRIMEENNNFGYQIDVQNNYLTYSQAILGFLLIAYVYFFMVDNQKEDIIETRKIVGSDRFKYYIYDLLVMIIPIIVYTYLFGVILNIYSYVRFKVDGFPIKYFVTTEKYGTVFLPTIIAYIAVLVLLISIFKENFGVTVPIYLAWVIMNLTPNVFKNHKLLSKITVVNRLDGVQTIVDYDVGRRVIILILASLILVFSYRFQYKKRKKN